MLRGFESKLCSVGGGFASQVERFDFHGCLKLIVSLVFLHHYKQNREVVLVTSHKACLFLAKALMVTDGNIYQLFLKSAMTTFYLFKMTIVQPPSPMTTVYQACITIPAVRDSSLIHYGNTARQLTKSSLHHRQALFANLGRRGHAATSSTTLQTSNDLPDQRATKSPRVSGSNEVWKATYYDQKA